MYLLQSRLDGIPCWAEIKYQQGYPGTWERGGRQLEPDEPPCYEITNIYDMQGERAEWLIRKLEDKEIERKFLNNVSNQLDGMSVRLEL